MACPEPPKRKCCCAPCKVGDVIPRWQNQTLVRPSGDSGAPGAPNYTAVPVERKDALAFPEDCAISPKTCGDWIAGGVGDYNGTSSQVIDDIVDDILACGEDDETHKKIDRNCYFKNGDTRDMRMSRLFGFQKIHARKFWHGRLGFTSTDRCSLDPTLSPDQTLYRTISGTITGKWFDQDGGLGPCGNMLTYFELKVENLVISVDRYTGITTVSGTYTCRHYDGVSYIPLTIADSDINTHLWSRIKQLEWACGVPDFYQSALDTGMYDGLDVSRLERTATNTHHEIHIETEYSTPTCPGETFTGHYLHCTLDLSDAYTAADCYQDLKDLLFEWDMSNMTLAKFRGKWDVGVADEFLTLAALCVYDEIGPSVPNIFTQTAGVPSDVRAFTMDDYSGTISGGVWPQTDWLDPQSFVWEYGGHRFPHGSPPVGFTGGATKKTGLRAEKKISHSEPGSDRHFWWGYAKFTRELDSDPESACNGKYHWRLSFHGGYPDERLCTNGNTSSSVLRWLDNREAQAGTLEDCETDEVKDRNHWGMYPQGFVFQRGQTVWAGKYVQATQKWPRVDFGRPCGADKYAVEQSSACCLTGGDGIAGFIVRPAASSPDPGTAGGLAVGDYIAVEGDGVYQISNITTAAVDIYGRSQWLLIVSDTVVSGKIDDLPAGYEFSDPLQVTDGNHVGKLRWINYTQYGSTWTSAPGICGRAAVTASWADGTLTITGAALPYFRVCPVMGELRGDLYSADMAHSLLNVLLTRVSDTEWAATMDEPAFTVAWMTSHGVDYTKHGSDGWRKGVKLEWGFDFRAVAAGSGSSYAGRSGCTGCTATEIQYDTGACPSAACIAPFQRVEGVATTQIENFGAGPKHVAIDFPAEMTFDIVYGSLWQCAAMLTMPDPFWETPFKPDCENIPGDPGFTWLEDTGAETENQKFVTEGETTTEYRYYAHRPLVEALCAVPAGYSLPTGVSLHYDPAAADIAPPFFEGVAGINGVPHGGGIGVYSGVEMDFGFSVRVCGTPTGAFAPRYSYVPCQMP